MKRTFASFAFGCRVNEAEKLKLNKELINAGFSYAEDKPDVFIINSCSVTQKAEREVRQFIYQIRKKFPQTKIVVTGCSATLWLKNNTLLKEADLFIANQEKNNLVNILMHDLSLRGSSDSEETKQSRSLLTGRLFHSINRIRNDNFFPDKFLDSQRLLIKIQDGCQRYCSYCIVPYLRGKPTSPKISEIVFEIKKYPLIQEVILSAINTEYFGQDNQETLIDLIQAVLTQTNIPKISFGSIHPWSMTNEFLAYYKSILPYKRFVDFFHIPLQSGSDVVLKLMNRKYQILEIYEKLLKIKKLNSAAFIGTDIIVGFPGETEKEFQETYQFLKSVPIDRFHVFKFSLRSGTVAEYLSKKFGEVTPKIKANRSQKLIDLSNRKFRDFQKSLVGKNDTALVLPKKIENFHEALLSNNIPIKIRVKNDLVGKIIKVKITSIENANLFAIPN